MKKNNMSASLTGQIFILAFPIILENLLQALLGTADTWFAGQLDDTAIAAIGATSLITNLFFALYAALSIGISSMISRYIGENNYEKANHTLNQSILAALFLGIIVAVLTFIFQDAILELSGADAMVITTAKPYYLIVAVPSVFVCISQILSASLRAVKDTVTSMVIFSVSNILNIVLDALFLYLGFGICGLALATTLSRIIACLALFLCVHNKTQHFHITWSFMIPDSKILLNIARITLPTSFERLIMRISQFIYNGLIFAIGTNDYVAHSIAGTIEYYSYILAFGFSAAASTLVGICLGENDRSKAKNIVWKTWILSSIFMLPVGFVFFFGSPFLVLQFTETIGIQQKVIQVLRLIAFFQPVIAFSNVFASALQGAGDTRFPMYTTLFGTGVIHIGLGYVFGIRFGLGLFGIWIAYALNNLFRSILLYLRFRSEAWTNIQL